MNWNNHEEVFNSADLFTFSVTEIGKQIKKI